MIENGAIKLSKKQFSKIISDYYQKNYKINVVFDFLRINYEYLEKTTGYNYSIDNDMILSNKKTVQAYLPCIVDVNSYEYYKQRNIVVPGIIKIEYLSDEINKVLPPEIRRIHNYEITEIFRLLGYTQPLYNWAYDSETGEPEYSVVTKKIENIEKQKTLHY